MKECTGSEVKLSFKTKTLRDIIIHFLSKEDYSDFHVYYHMGNTSSDHRYIIEINTSWAWMLKKIYKIIDKYEDKEWNKD